LVGLVIWASFGFRYSTYAGPPADAGRFRDPWEHVLGLPDPVETLERLNLRDDQHRAAQAALAANGVRADAWTPEAVRALDEIRGRILTPGQVRLLDEARAAPPPAAAARFLAFLRNHRLLPEAYIYGYAASWRYAQSRSAFFNGEFSLSGWRWFFPYTFLVKTPLPFLVMLLLATGLAVGGAGAPRGRGRELAYALLPLATLWVVYWVAVIPSHVDIGHRHILATYPPLFILCGVVAEWAGRSRHRAPAAVVLALLALQAAEMAWRFPNYLAYFNSLNGGPGRAYRHLVDSSLDWGQDLPGVGTYLRKHPSAGPAYLAYLGAGSPEYYRTPAQLIYPRTQPVLILAYPAPPAAKLGEEILQAHPDYRIVAAGRREAVETVVLLKKPAALRLGAGTYFISASLLQPLGYNGPGPWGPWNDRYEARYQALAVQAKPLLEDEGPARSAAWRVRSIAEWAQILRDYDAFRFGRLTASLRRREPDDTVNFSILVYHLTDAELARALEGPTPERGRDLLRELDPSGAAPGKSAGSPLP
jgi:hypothetical protein